MKKQFSLLIALFCCLLTALPARGQLGNPKEAIVTAARGTQVTLDIGSRAGVKPGTVFGITHDGKVRARLRVTAVQPDSSTATVYDAEPDFVVAVGDSAEFIAVLPLPANPVQSATPAAVMPTPIPTPAPVTTPLPPTPVPTVATPSTPAPTMTAPAAPNTVTIGTGPTVAEVQGQTIVLGAGTEQGLHPATNVPILRNGSIVAIVRVRTATTNSSSGEVVWQDEKAGSLAPGDAIGVLPQVPTTTVVTVNATPTPAAPNEVHGIELETGASNAVVPRADHTYEYLASLAATGLITRYPASVFVDDGVRRHRTEGDVTFTRAQIADLIREALRSPRLSDPTSKMRATLGILLEDYAKELRQLGVNTATYPALAPHKRIELGTSGQQRVSLVGGTTTGVIDPFSERQGGQREKSGYDTRNNYFARSGDKWRFFATTESGSDTRKNADDSGIKLRRAVLSYRADRYVRGLTVDVGRDELWWGPGHFGSLLLSDASGPHNLVHTTLRRGSYQLEGLYARLHRGPTSNSRSLYGHHLSAQVTPQIRLGIAEAVLLPQDSLDPLLFATAFLPFPSFTAERIRHRGTDPNNGNDFVMPYVEASVARGLQGYFELLFDDLSVNNSNLVRSRVGNLLGLHAFTPRDPAKLGGYLEYANMQGRTYLALNNLTDSDYFDRGAPLGYPVAPTQTTLNGGASTLRFDTYWRPQRRWMLGLGVEIADINSEDPVFARQQVVRLRASYELARNWTLTGRARRVQTSQPNFVLNEPAVKQNLFQLELSRAF